MNPAAPAELAGFCRDCFLLARYAPPGEGGRPGGRAWEQAVASLLWRPGISRRQYAGTIGLFGSGSASGARHEIDGAGHGPTTGIWVEAKARTTLDKSDIATFDMKCFDLYTSAAKQHPRATRSAAWWPVFVSSEPASEPVRRLCMALGIVLCDPLRLPLPRLLRTAAHPEADMELPETLLTEAVRLFEPLCRSMQKRWQISEDAGSLVQSLGLMPTPPALADAMYVQDELSADILDYMDVTAPAAIERRAGLLTRLLDRRAQAAA